MRICAYPNFPQIDRVLSALQIDLSARTDEKMVILYVYLRICVSAQQKHDFTEQMRR
jgi:hypothetical protein